MFRIENKGPATNFATMILLTSVNMSVPFVPS
jgi:hypothetical protein